MAEQQYTMSNARAIIRANFGLTGPIPTHQVRLMQRFMTELRQAFSLEHRARRRRVRELSAHFSREWSQ